MAEISKIITGGVEYDIKDPVAREMLENGGGNGGNGGTDWLARYNYHIQEVTANAMVDDLKGSRISDAPWGDNGVYYFLQQWSGIFYEPQGGWNNSAFESLCQRWENPKFIVIHPTTTRFCISWSPLNLEGVRVFVPQSVTSIDGFGGWSVGALDLFMFKDDVAFPTKSAGWYCSKILVPKGRKAELASMTNWAELADNMEEVDVW